MSAVTAEPSPTEQPRVAVLGLGLMGAPIARRLLGAGTAVTVWNRTSAKAEPLGELRARVAADPAEAVAGCDVAILVLADQAAVDEVLEARGVADALAPGSLVIDVSSIAPAAARRHAVRLAKQGVAHLDAPVSGGTRGAEEGTLTIFVGGLESAFARAHPVLSIVGTPHHVGDSGSGQVAKLVNQVIVGVTIGALAEAFVFAASNGTNPAKLRSALLGGFADSRILREHGRRMVERDFTPGGKVASQIKDLRTVLTLAREAGLVLPLTERVDELFAALADTSGPELDHSALLLELERLNDVPRSMGLNSRERSARPD